MQEILEKGHAEVAPPIDQGIEKRFLPLFGVYHPKKPDKIRVVFHSSDQLQGNSLNRALLTGTDMLNSKDILEYRMKVHTFDNSPSPAVASFGPR